MGRGGCARAAPAPAPALLHRCERASTYGHRCSSKPARPVPHSGSEGKARVGMREKGEGEGGESKSEAEGGRDESGWQYVTASTVCAAAPNRRVRLRVGEGCIRTRTCTQSPSTRAHCISICLPIPGCALLRLNQICICSCVGVSIHFCRQAHEMRRCGKRGKEVAAAAAS
jgi:hypothetical protein